jgi:hypothetical protein
MDKQRMEECIDELYSIQKKTGERMIEFSEEGKSLIEKLAFNSQRYKNDLTYYSVVYFWAMVASILIIIGVSFFLYYSFEKRYAKDIELLEFIALKAKIVVEEQSELLKSLGIEHHKNKTIKK